MDERRGDQPDTETGAQPPAVAGNARLSPVQQAYGRATRHSLECGACRDIDAAACNEGAELWQAYREQTAAAYRKIASAG